MKYLLDTNTCVHFLRHGTASSVATKLSSADPADVVLCAVVVGELLFGALRSRDVQKNLVDVHTFLAGFRSLAFDDLSAEKYAQVRADLTSKGC